MGNKNSFVADNDRGLTMSIWLSTGINKPVEYEKIQQQLRTIIKHFKAFDDVKECEKYIRSIDVKERLLLIVDEQQARDIIRSIHTLQQVTIIYIYCKNNKGHEQWMNQFSKIKGIIRHPNELVSRIKADQDKLLLLNKKSSTISNDVHFQLEFAYSQLISNVLVRLKPKTRNKTELVSLCENLSKHSQSDLTILREFQQTYSSDRALWWYTRSICFDKILNKALKTQDIQTIFHFQFFIYDIYRQLIQNQYPYPITVYRSKLMTDDEINILMQSVGYSISIHTLFSAMIDRNLAFDVLKKTNCSHGLHRVFFEINADPNVVTTKPFADITKYSYFSDEGEILFAIGSIFLITKMQAIDDEIWIIHMTLSSDKGPDLSLVFQEMQKIYGDFDGNNVFPALSHVLRDMQKIDEAEKYCHVLLENFSLNNSLLGILYDELAEFALNKHNSKLYEQWHQKAIQMKMKIEFDSSSNSKLELKNSTNIDHYSDENTWRFMDIAAENHAILLPIEGHEKMPLVSLEEAVLPLVQILPDIERKAYIAKLKCSDPADGLTSDQSAAIMLYTMEWAPHDQCLYFVLNAQLRRADRNKLKSWFLYLKLILTGLSRLPSIERTVYRGVRLDLSAQYQEGKQFFWWGFSSCTKTVKVLECDQYLGNNGTRTLFHIECVNGKDIRRHSYYDIEDEILLLPASFFEVISSVKMATDLHIIQLKEIKPKYSLLEPVI